MAKKRKKPPARGPKGVKKHTPGRDHDRKSGSARKKRFSKKARQRREARRKEAERQWTVWDNMSEDERKWRKELFPKYPRPADDSEQ
jgi:hypothetical protein